jgi:putative protein kinase ArgK-like GTPase of G3E family
MKRQNQKAVILAVGVVIMLIGGCGGEDASKSEVKRGRLISAKIAVENKQLKKGLERCEKELEEQKELLAKCLQEQKESLARCLQEKKDSEEQLQKSSAQTIEGLKAKVKQLEEEINNLKDSKKFKEWEETQKSIKDLSEIVIRDLEEIAKLQEENENLKTEITELKKELETHKGPTPLPHTD